MTFPVSDVEPARRPLPEVYPRDSIEGLLAAERLTRGKAYDPPEAWSRHAPRLVAQVEFHPLMAALRLAYKDHRPLSLSPDMIWLLICQGVAHHINANAEALRHLFVQHPGRLTLEVRFPEPRRPRILPSDDPWPEVFHQLSSQIGSRLGPKREFLLPTFSTTGPVERSAAEIAFLGSMTKYFHGLLTAFVCGIPAITLEGSAADWQSILDRLDRFAELGLAWWTRSLHPILRQFAAAATGTIEGAFWKSIYRVHGPTAAPIDPEADLGWIGLFFPYVSDRSGASLRPNPWLSSGHGLDEMLDPQAVGRHAGDSHQADLVHERDLPSGLASVPFLWDERGPAGEPRHRREMELLGGFVGVAQDRKTLTLRPEIGWGVRESHGNS